VGAASLRCGVAAPVGEGGRGPPAARVRATCRGDRERGRPGPAVNAHTGTGYRWPTLPPCRTRTAPSGARAKQFARPPCPAGATKVETDPGPLPTRAGRPIASTGASGPRCRRAGPSPPPRAPGRSGSRDPPAPPGQARSRQNRAPLPTHAGRPIASTGASDPRCRRARPSPPRTPGRAMSGAGCFLAMPRSAPCPLPAGGQSWGVFIDRRWFALLGIPERGGALRPGGFRVSSRDPSRRALASHPVDRTWSVNSSVSVP
jgi:hypothetical protein